MPISDIVAIVTKMTCFKKGDPILSASGFFYAHNNDLFLVTNRHVVIEEDKNFFPDELKLRLHTDQNDVQRNEDYLVPLYSSNKRVWREHPSQGKEIDVVAIPLNSQEIQSRFFVRALGMAKHIPNDIDISIGEDVQVIGYPLGFHDQVHNLPIVRNATMASVYPVPFEGRPYILIDSRLHRGTSGSPVMTKPTQMIRRIDGSTAMMSGPVKYFVGVHSASLDLTGRDPQYDEPLGLNVVWFAALIPEIITQQSG